MTGDIRLERRGGLGVVVLDRQRALNALSREMVQALSLRLLEWRDDPEVAAVLIKAAPGRAFCAGGDIRGQQEAGPAGMVGFFREEYRLNWRIHCCPKPYVALLDGIVMGGGAGVSVHGSHRVVTENTLFAMPETGIGFFPDVGATHFLPRCPGAVGAYLGLTGERLRAADCLYAGIGTHHVPADRLAGLEDALAGLRPGATGRAEVDAVLRPFATDAAEAPPLAAWRGDIDACFGRGSLAEAVAALGRDTGGFGAAALEQLRAKSPLSLHVAFAQLRRGASLGIEEALRLEFRVACRFAAGEEFAEGVRALLVDKDKRPRWRHADVAAVPAEEVEGYFAPLPGGDELAFDWQGL